MVNIVESSTWEPGVYQLETKDPVIGGLPVFNSGVPIAGYSNAQAQQLSNRTKWLYDNKVNLTHIGSNNEHPLVTTLEHGFMSSSDKLKLDGVAEGATANSSDSTLLSRSNHTGVQPISSVSGLQNAIDSAMFAPVILEGGITRLALLSDAGAYVRFTSSDPKSYTVQKQSIINWQVNTEIHGRNAGSSELTILPDAGVTIDPPHGGTLLIPPSGSFTLKRVSLDVWDLIGQTVPA